MGTRDSPVAELGEDRLILLPNLSQYALVCNGCKLSSILSFLAGAYSDSSQSWCYVLL